MRVPYYRATFAATLPAHDPREMRELGAKECSRVGLPRVVRHGTPCYVCRYTGTGLWLVYLDCGMVLKMTTECAKVHLRLDRDGHGRPLVDLTGRGAELADAQNQRAGNVPRRKELA